MSKAMKIWLMIGAVLILIGLIVLGGVMTVLKWDFAKLSTNQYETNRYEVNESFSAISIDTDTADIALVPTDDETCAVVCCEQKNLKHTVAVKDGRLIIELTDTRKWYEHIGIYFGTTTVTVYLPQAEYSALTVKTDTGGVEIPRELGFESIDVCVSTGYVTSGASVSGAVKIKTTTGDICVDNIVAGSLDLSVSTGMVTASEIACTGNVSVSVSTGKAVLTNVTCQNLSSSGSTGDITLKQVVAQEGFSITRSTGDVRLENSDAAEIWIETDTGDVVGSLLTDKVFITKTDTGRVHVPKTVTGGKCEITTDTGDIRIRV